MAEAYIIEGVEALWPKVDRTYSFNSKIKRSEPCDARDQNAAYSIAFRMDGATAKALFKAMKVAYADNRDDDWDEKLSNPFVKEDNGMYTHKANLKGAYNGETTNKPLEVDSMGTPLPEKFQLTTGSTVNVAVHLIPYRMKLGKEWDNGVSLRLKAVQVIKYIPMEVRNPFSAVEGGFVYKGADDNPFAKSAAPKSNNVLADADDDDMDEPPKKTVKKAAQTKDTGDDIGDIVESWDD
jgi:hypothetical protein|tara:strand:+ start:43 stop:756 length:714 start_codon:yes stop_codon:yes gene_type:complete